MKRGLLMTAVAAVPTYIGALLITGTIFTAYFSSLRTAQEESLLASGLDADVVVAQLDKARSSNTPGGFAFAGFVGTLAIGLFASLGAAAVLRERKSQK